MLILLSTTNLFCRSRYSRSSKTQLSQLILVLSQLWKPLIILAQWALFRIKLNTMELSSLTKTLRTTSCLRMSPRPMKMGVNNPISPRRPLSLMKGRTVNLKRCFQLLIKPVSTTRRLKLKRTLKLAKKFLPLTGKKVQGLSKMLTPLKSKTKAILF